MLLSQEIGKEFIVFIVSLDLIKTKGVLVSGRYAHYLLDNAKLRIFRGIFAKMGLASIRINGN